MTTREKIIKLIEPYMRKDLSEGCYIEETRESLIKEHGGFYKIVKVGDKGISFYNKKGQLIGDWFDNIDDYKIIGHYDITAVLKYIRRSCNYNINFPVGSDDYITYYSLNKAKISIPNKPLHLYTEQELRDLLETLNNLLIK